MGTEVWVLGGTGRSGRAIVAELDRRGLSTVLVGRDANRLAAAARATGSETVVTSSLAATATEIRRRRPAVVINTVGPFTTTAGPVIDACLAGGHYVDLANDVAAVSATLGRHDAATAAGRTLVTGAGFGVTATESVVVKLCEGRPAPLRVRVDMVPSLAMEAGVVGEALAGTILDGLPGVEGGGRFQGRQIEDGRLAPARIGGDVLRLTLPDGSEVTTASMPLGELLAAQRASGARFVLSASSEAPSGTLVRAVMPAALSRARSRRTRSSGGRSMGSPESSAVGSATMRSADDRCGSSQAPSGSTRTWRADEPRQAVAAFPVSGAPRRMTTSGQSDPVTPGERSRAS